MLPKTATEQDLTGMFAIFGELREVHIIRGPEGGSKGCAFVKFNHRESAITAIRNLHDSIPMVFFPDIFFFCKRKFNFDCYIREQRDHLW